MTLRSTPLRYGAVAVAIHWIAAAALLVALASGFRGASADPTTKLMIVRAHAAAGILALVLMLARIAWWWMADRKPEPIGGRADFFARVASAVHVLFYVIVLGMAASGIGMMALSGADKIVFGEVGGALPDFWLYPPRLPHGIGARVLIALLVLHVGGAFYHQFVLRDRLFARIGLGR